MKPVTLLRKKIFIGVFCALLASALSMDAAVWAAHKKPAAPGDDCVCPVTLLENKDMFPALIRVIDGAQREIVICMFSFKAGVHPKSYPDQVLDRLAHAVQRGVQVKVILEAAQDRTNELTAQNLKTLALLKEKGVEVYLDTPKKTTHTKLVLVDERIVLMGSHNLTSSALKHNNEISVLIEQPKLAAKVRQYILKIIKEAK